MRRLLLVVLLCGTATCGKKSGTGGTTGGSTGGSTTVTYNGPQTRFIGRTQAVSGGTLMAWSSTAVETRFTGTSITMSITAAADGQASVMVLYVDGQQEQTFTVKDGTNSYSYGGLSSGVHTARLVKITEAGVGQIIFGGFTTDGTLMNTETPSGRLIEIIGDSISAGYGDTAQNPSLCNESPPYPADPNYENGYLAYGPQTALKFGADWSVVAWSGKGVYENRNPSDTVTMPQLFPLINPVDTTSTYNYSSKADVVVIDLCTNDFYAMSQGNTATIPSSDQAPFTTAYTNLIKNVRSAYPNAYIIIALGPMLSHSYPVGDQLGLAESWFAAMEASVSATDGKVKFIEFAANPLAPGDFGCDDHPSASYQLNTMLPTLANEISQLTGWQVVESVENS